MGICFVQFARWRHQSDVRQPCLVEIARWRHRRRSLPSPTALFLSVLNELWFVFVSWLRVSCLTRAMLSSHCRCFRLTSRHLSLGHVIRFRFFYIRRLALCKLRSWPCRQLRQRPFAYCSSQKFYRNFAIVLNIYYVTSA